MKENKNRKKIIMIIISMLVVLIISFVVFFTLKANRDLEQSKGEGGMNIPSENHEHIEPKDYADLTLEENKQQIEDFFQERTWEQIKNINDQENVTKERTIEGLLLRNVRLYQEENVITFMAELYNPTDKDIKDFVKELIFVNQEGKEIGTMTIGIGKDTLKSKYSYPILSMKADAEFSAKEVYDYNIK